MGLQLPLKGAHTPIFVPCLYCGQTAGWMKTPLGTEVDLGSGHIVLDGDPAPPAKGAQQPPSFSADVYCGHGRPSQLLLSSRKFRFAYMHPTVACFPLSLRRSHSSEQLLSASASFLL